MVQYLLNIALSLAIFNDSPLYFKFAKQDEIGTHGPHPAYTDIVNDTIGKTFGKNLDKMNPEQVSQTFKDVIIPKMRKIAETAEKSGQNLNDYAKTLK